MADSVFSSALSTAPDDLIEPSTFGRELPASPSPTIEDSIGLDLGRLPGYEKVPPLKKAKSSWTWEHGYELMKSDGSRWWVCRLCHHTKVSNGVRPHIYSSKSSTHTASHMKRCHPSVANVYLRGEEGHSPTVVDQLRRPVIKESTLVTPFNTKQFKSALLEWLIHDDITFRQAASTRLRKLLVLANPLIEPIAPHSHGTVSLWIQELFEAKKKEVIELLVDLKSKVNISFDLWTSGNYLPLLGVVAHFIGKYSF